MHPASHVGAVEEHGRELQYLEVFVSVAYAVLSVEDVVLAGAFQDEHHGDEQRGQDYYGDTREEDIQKAFEVFVHCLGLFLDRINRIYRIRERS